MKTEKKMPPHEALKSYITRTDGVWMADFARKLSVSKTIVTRWCSGFCCPNRVHAAEIEKLTGIPAMSWPRTGTWVDTPAILTLKRIADERLMSTTELGRSVGISQRNMCRYFEGHPPADAVIDLINRKLKLKLTSEDYVVYS